MNIPATFHTKDGLVCLDRAPRELFRIIKRPVLLDRSLVEEVDPQAHMITRTYELRHFDPEAWGRGHPHYYEI